MPWKITLLCFAITMVAGCSGDDDDDAPGHGADAAMPASGSHAAGGRDASATGSTMTAASGGAMAAASGGSEAVAAGSGGRNASDAGAVGADAGGEDPAPNYGILKVLPDTSSDKIADCTGQPDMTLCNVVTAPDRAYDICADEKCVSPGCGDQSCNVPGPHFRIPPFFDHRALERQAGDEPITIDLITGLHWQGCLAGKTGADCTTGTALQLKWNDALAYCDALQWSGHDDWYLPDPYELTSIMEDDVEPAARVRLTPSAFPSAEIDPEIEWTSACMGPQQAMAISTSTTSLDPITSQQHTDTMVAVRCVRRGFSRATSPAHARYTKSTDASKPVFFDHATGLMWPSCLERIPGATECSDLLDKVTTMSAIQRCEALVWADSSGWRVPTYKELHSLLLYPRETTLTEAKLDDSVVQPAGPLLITTEGHLFSTDGRRVDLSGTYPYLCVRGPLSATD
jgi:hypothetical protein